MIINESKNYSENSDTFMLGSDVVWASKLSGIDNLSVQESTWLSKALNWKIVISRYHKMFTMVVAMIAMNLWISVNEVNAQRVACTQEVIDSLQNWSPFPLWHVIEWEAAWDDDINLPPIWWDNTTLILDWTEVPSWWTIVGWTMNSIEMSGIWEEWALSTTNTTCNPSSLMIFEVEAAVLPVSTTSFELINEKYWEIEVVWDISQTINVSHLEFFRSYDGKTRESIWINDEIDGNSNSPQTIRFTDRTYNKLEDKVYYKWFNHDYDSWDASSLTSPDQIDNINDEEFTETRVIILDWAYNPKLDWPNPMQLGNDINISWENADVNLKDVELYSPMWRLLKQDLDIYSNWIRLWTSHLNEWWIYTVVVLDNDWFPHKMRVLVME